MTNSHSDASEGEREQGWDLLTRLGSQADAERYRSGLQTRYRRRHGRGALLRTAVVGGCGDDWEVWVYRCRYDPRTMEDMP